MNPFEKLFSGKTKKKKKKNSEERVVTLTEDFASHISDMEKSAEQDLNGSSETFEYIKQSFESVSSDPTIINNINAALDNNMKILEGRASAVESNEMNTQITDNLAVSRIKKIFEIEKELLFAGKDEVEEYISYIKGEKQIYDAIALSDYDRIGRTKYKIAPPNNNTMTAEMSVNTILNEISLNLIRAFEGGRKAEVHNCIKALQYVRKQCFLTDGENVARQTSEMRSKIISIYLTMIHTYGKIYELYREYISLEDKYSKTRLSVAEYIQGLNQLSQEDKINILNMPFEKSLAKYSNNQKIQTIISGLMSQRVAVAELKLSSAAITSDIGLMDTLYNGVKSMQDKIESTTDAGMNFDMAEFSSTLNNVYEEINTSVKEASEMSNVLKEITDSAEATLKSILEDPKRIQIASESFKELLEYGKIMEHNDNEMKVLNEKMARGEKIAQKNMQKEREAILNKYDIDIENDDNSEELIDAE